MAIQQKFSIVCDEVRQEIGGKLIIIGMYTPDIGVPMLPVVLPVLTFLVWAESDQRGDFHFQIKLTHLETGQAVVQGAMGVRYEKPGIALLPVRLTNVSIVGAGAYTFSLHLDGQDDLLTQFSVILNIPPLQVQMPGMQRR